MKMQLQAKAYGPNSTQSEIDLLSNRISAIGDDIILYREVPVVSDFQIEVFSQRIESILRAGNGFYIIVDLSEIRKIPGSKLRSKIHDMFRAHRPKIIHGAFVYGQNIFLRIPAKVIAAKVFQSVTVHATIRKAEEEIQKRQASSGR